MEARSSDDRDDDVDDARKTHGALGENIGRL